MTKEKILQQIHEAELAAGNIAIDTAKVVADSYLPKLTPGELLVQSEASKIKILEALGNAKSYIESRED